MWLLVLALFALALVVAGAPFVPTHKAELKSVFEQLGEGDERVFVDLGCGDGRVLELANQRGFQAVGYEINPILWLVARLRLNSDVKLKLWPWQLADIGGAEVVYIFSTSWHLKNLKRSALPEFATVVIYGPQPPDWKRLESSRVGSAVIYRPSCAF